MFVDCWTFKCERDNMLHYEQVFRNVFERRESKCCAVLMKHCCKVKGEQVITLQIAQQLKTKNINFVQDHYFVVSVNLCLVRDRLTVLMIKINSICYRHWQWIHWVSNTKKKVPTNRHFTCQLTHIYENFKERYFRSI